MQPDSHPGIHLSYCSNIHPGETWGNVFLQLKTHLPELKRRISNQKPFGIGLRLSAGSAAQLLERDNMNEFKKWLQNENLYVFTINGFPYGNFHHERVKDHVYKPDWSTAERLEYTSRLIDIMAELIPSGSEGSISTSPVSYKYWDHFDSTRTETANKAAVQLASLAYKMAGILSEENKDIHVDLEPEPDCFIENTEETIRYFIDILIPEGKKYLESEFGISSDYAERIIRKHVGICYDTCHFALQYENPESSLQALRKAGIRLGKVQISAALKVILGSNTQRKALFKRLQHFAEPVYLHQVIERRENGFLNRYRDLSDALAHIFDEKACEWRIHFHVPVFAGQFDGLESTQNEIVKSLKVILSGNYSHHFEIETYTWEVLPQSLKTSLTESIERELFWTLGEMEKLSDTE